MKRLLMSVSLLAVIVLAIPGIAQGQADPRAGTWKLDAAKSKYTPGPPPSSETRTYEIQGHAMKVSIESVDAKGNQVSLRYTATDDGKDSPLTGIAFADSITVKRLDAYTFVMDTKKSGKIIGTSKAAISKDGKVLTLTSDTAGADGSAIHNVAIYEKK